MILIFLLILFCVFVLFFSFPREHVFVFFQFLLPSFLFFFFNQKSNTVHSSLILWTTLLGRDHLQPLPDNWGYLIQKPKLSPAASRVTPSLTVPCRETSEGSTLAATYGTSVMRERELEFAMCPLWASVFPSVHRGGLGPDVLEGLCQLRQAGNLQPSPHRSGAVRQQTPEGIFLKMPPSPHLQDNLPKPRLADSHGAAPRS